MPKVNHPKLIINLDLLRPQSNPEKLPIKLIRWLLSTGRYIFIFVEAIVLIAFGARFKLDADLASAKEAIEQQIPYIESLKPDEILIRQTQLKLTSIGTIKTESIDYSAILKKIADQTPNGVKINTLNVLKNTGKTSVQINAQSQTNTDLTSFIQGLKSDQTFSEINLASVGLEKGNITFTVTATANLAAAREKSL